MIPSSLLQAIQQAGAAYSRRDWVEAERLCRLALSEKADFFDALTLLGIIAAQTHRAREAEELFGRAVAVNPGDVLTHINRGLALQELQRPDEALASYERAIKLKPDYPDAYFNRGNALQDLARPIEHIPGTVALSQSAPNQNGSQFFLTTVDTPWLDAKHVVFGAVTEGMDIVKKIEGYGSQSGKTSKKIVVADSGQL